MPPDKSGAIVVLVKTPGLSPVKTRLAASIGTQAAELFYIHSAKAVASIVFSACKTTQGLKPYWAVAEKAGLNAHHWNQFDTIWQGDGELGNRLFHIYNELLKYHSFVIMMGADCPFISTSLLNKSAFLLTQAKTPTFVLGRALDGGFYLVGGLSPIYKPDWLSVPYSSATTAERLASTLKNHGLLTELPWLPDVDTFEDLKQVPRFIHTNTESTAEQQALMSWHMNFLQLAKYDDQ